MSGTDPLAQHLRNEARRAQALTFARANTALGFSDVGMVYPSADRDGFAVWAVLDSHGDYVGKFYDDAMPRHASCTGLRYPVNPDFPEEGADIHHDGPCPVHEAMPRG